MTAIDKLRAAFAAQITRNVDPHSEFIMVGALGAAGELTDIPAMLMAMPEPEESWQDPDPDAEAEPLTLFDMMAVLDEIAELSQRPPVDRAAEPEETDPGKRYMQLLAEWQDNRRKLAYYKEQEGTQRRVLFAGTFPNPVEGTNKHKLPDGRTIKGQYKIGRKLDEAALPATLARMRELGVANTDALVNYKPSLAKREWNTLSDEMKLEFSPAVIATPGMPGLDVEMPKGL